MALTQEQIDFITNTTNARGGAHSPSYTFFATQTTGPDNEYLNIIVDISTHPGDLLGGTKKGKKGWNDGTVNADFRALVDDCLTTCERHM
jgi:hypothetical protein